MAKLLGRPGLKEQAPGWQPPSCLLFSNWTRRGSHLALPSVAPLSPEGVKSESAPGTWGHACGQSGRKHHACPSSRGCCGVPWLRQLGSPAGAGGTSLLVVQEPWHPGSLLRKPRAVFSLVARGHGQIFAPLIRIRLTPNTWAGRAAAKALGLRDVSCPWNIPGRSSPRPFTGSSRQTTDQCLRRGQGAQGAGCACSGFEDRYGLPPALPGNVRHHPSAGSAVLILSPREVTGRA